MDTLGSLAQQKGYDVGSLTIGECIELAAAMNIRVSEVVIAEAMQANKMSKEEVTSSVLASFCHNLYAMEIGLTSGQSFLMGTVGQELAADNVVLNADAFVNKALQFTLGAQVGNHAVGLQPCAGTGDSCTYTGLVKAMLEVIEDQEEVARLTALLLKVGTIFRAGKSTTGCNMEGFGAGAAATAVVTAEMLGATPEQVGKALVLALSPTIGTPCTPRVMVAGLCATHLGGGILIGHFAANLAVKTNIPLNVPPDVMIAMAAAVHPQSAKHIVPTVIKYMEPFFKTNDAVEHYIHQDIKDKETIRIDETISQAKNEARALAAKANSIVKPFGDAVVGGSSQAVGSPTNTARIAHGLIEGEVTAVKVELYPELFARRGINVPGILMAAVRGAGTDNYKCYRSIMDEVSKSKLKVEIIEVDEPQLQRITITATGKSAMVEALNRGGGRLVIKNASPSVDIAKQVAKKLDIEVVD
jgi:L-serine dehydratase